MLEDGKGVRVVTHWFDVSLSVVSQLWKCYQETGQCSRRQGQDPLHKTTPRQDLYLITSQEYSSILGNRLPPCYRSGMLTMLCHGLDQNVFRWLYRPICVRQRWYNVCVRYCNEILEPIIRFRDETVWKFHITIIVTKIIISIIVVLLKCAENVQKVLIHTLKSFHQVLFWKLKLKLSALCSFCLHRPIPRQYLM